MTGLVANDRFADFRCVQTAFELGGDAVRLSAEASRTLNLTTGDQLRYWTKD